jgi:hypothetical protein
MLSLSKWANQEEWHSSGRELLLVLVNQPLSAVSLPTKAR